MNEPRSYGKIGEAKVWDREKALDVMRKVAAMAVDITVTEAERKQAEARLFELATKYEIDAAEAYERGEISEQIIHIFWNAPKPWIQKMTVANLIATHTSCTAIRLGEFRNRLHVFGFESDIKMFKMLVESVLAQGELKFASTPIPAGSVPRTFRRSWWQGAAHGLATQTVQAKKKVTAESGTPTTALVLRDKQEAVDEEVGKAYPKLRKARRSRTRFTAGQVEGYRAGKEFDLGSENRLAERIAKQIDR